MKNPQEYAALKNEISQCLQFEFVAQTTMITAVIAIFAIAFQQHSPWLFLLYFQSFINKKRNVRLKIAAFIRVFYNDADRWEKAVGDVDKQIRALYPRQKGLLRQRLTDKTNPFAHRLSFLSRRSSFLFATLSALCSLTLYAAERGAGGFSGGQLWLFVLLVLFNALPVYGVHLLNAEVSNAQSGSDNYFDLFIALRNSDKSGTYI